jgi:hypothetical protein
MDVKEVVREIMTDVRWLENFQTMHEKIIAKELRRIGTVPATVVKQVRSPKTQNEWTILYTIHKSMLPVPLSTKYTTLQNEDGIYVYNPVISEDGLRLVILQPHFFRRYRERLGLGDKLKTPQLIRRYMKLNLNGSFMPSGKRDGVPVWSLCVEEGVVLGVYVSERVFLGRTFITYDMAHEGIQAETLRKGDENRLQLEVKITSARDMIKYSRETERITRKTEQEDGEQK